MKNALYGEAFLVCYDSEPQLIELFCIWDYALPFSGSCYNVLSF